MWTEFLIFSVIILFIVGLVMFAVTFCKWCCDQADKKEKERMNKLNERENNCVYHYYPCSSGNDMIVFKSSVPGK